MTTITSAFEDFHGYIKNYHNVPAFSISLDGCGTTTTPEETMVTNLFTALGMLDEWGGWPAQWGVKLVELSDGLLYNSDASALTYQNALDFMHDVMLAHTLAWHREDDCPAYNKWVDSKFNQ